MAYNKQYGGQFRGVSAPSKPVAAAAPVEADIPGEKVVITIGQLKNVEMEELEAPNERHFVAFAYFSGDDINEIMNKKRNRTPIVLGKYYQSSYSCSFSGEKIILPIADCTKPLVIYLAVITIKVKTEGGQTTREIGFSGIGYSQTFNMKKCSKIRVSAEELKLVQGGDPSIKPGTLDITVEVVQAHKGPKYIEDEVENLMASFQK